MPEIRRTFKFEQSCLIEIAKPRCLSWLCERCCYVKKFLCCCPLKCGAFIVALCGIFYVGSFIYLPYYRICSCKKEFLLSRMKLMADYDDLKEIFKHAIAYNPFYDINKYLDNLYKPVKKIIINNLLCLILLPYVLLSFISLLFLLFGCSRCCRCLATMLLVCIFLSQALSTFIIGTMIEGIVNRGCECYENWQLTLHSLIFYPIWFYFYIVIRSLKRLRRAKAREKKVAAIRGNQLLSY